MSHKLELCNDSENHIESQIDIPKDSLFFPFPFLQIVGNVWQSWERQLCV